MREWDTKHSCLLPGVSVPGGLGAEPGVLSDHSLPEEGKGGVGLWDGHLPWACRAWGGCTHSAIPPGGGGTVSPHRPQPKIQLIKNKHPKGRGDLLGRAQWQAPWGGGGGLPHEISGKF